MRKRIQFLGGAFVLMFALSFVMFRSASAEEMKHMHHGKNADMEMHHMHILMNHGLEMVTEGANLVMLAEMKMAPSLDHLTLEHGHHMITDGKELIDHTLSGHEMKSMHKAGHGDDPLMKYTHELGHAMMDYANIVDNMSMGDMSGDMMTMHHMHILINHAVDMAAEGSDLAMLGHMGMANGIDKESIEHGKMMKSDADKLLTEVMEGKAMTEMHKKGVKMDNEMMAETHKLGAAARKIIDLLSDMPK